MSSVSGIIWAVVLLLLNGFFVAAEFALLASRQSRLEAMAADGSKRAQVALDGKREISLMLAGAQLGITICSLLLGAVAEPGIAHLIETGIERFVHIPEAALTSIGFAIALSIVVLLHMVVGEMAPKSWAISEPERSAMLLAIPFRGFALVFRPIIVLLNMMANGVVRLFGIQPQDNLAMAHSPSDLLLLLNESADQGDGVAANENFRLAAFGEDVIDGGNKPAPTPSDGSQNGVTVIPPASTAPPGSSIPALPTTTSTGVTGQ